MQNEIQQCSNQFVVLISEFAWPAVFLVALYKFHASLKNLLESFSNRIRDLNSDISIGKEGVEIKAKIESVEVDQEQTKLLALRALGVKNNFPEISTGPTEELLSLASEYLQIDEPNWRLRLRKKDNLAQKMVELVVRENISRNELSRIHNEGLYLTLAAVSHLFPKQYDIDLLIDISKKTRRLHVKYRIVMAIGRLIDQGYISATQAGSVRIGLEQLKKGADYHLLERINYTLHKSFIN